MRVQVTHHAVSRGDRPSQEALRVEQHQEWLIAAFAEGVGAGMGGGEAAQQAVSLMVEFFHSRPQAWGAPKALCEFLQRINEAITHTSERTHTGAEMLCTLSVVVIEGGILHGLNVGHSPVHLWRQGTLRTLTKTQHAVGSEGGRAFTQALGLMHAPEPWLFEQVLEDGDLIVLSGSSLAQALPQESFQALLMQRSTARVFVKAATDAWVKSPEVGDDASAIVIDVQECGHVSAGPLRRLEVVHSLASGDHHDGFVLEKPLSAGGRVWLARDANGGTHVLKFAPLDVMDDEAARDSFLRELWHASRLEAPEFVHARVPSEGSLRYYVLEHIEAPTLEAILLRAPLTVAEALELARFLLRVGQYLSGREHIHGDINPAGILVKRTPQGLRFRMAGFGISERGGLGLGHTVDSGTLAPECLAGSLPSDRSEIFSIGATLYLALTRCTPYPKQGGASGTFPGKPARRPGARNSAVPRWLDHVILRALAIDVAERYQSFSEMLYDLDNPAQVVPPMRHEQPTALRNPLLFYRLLSAALAVLSLILFALLVWR